MIDGTDEPTGFISRRDLLKLAETSACTARLLPLTGCDNLWKRQPVIAVDRWEKGVCRFRGTGCGVMVGLKGKRSLTSRETRKPIP